MSTVDPITGGDIGEDPEGHPCLVDGLITMHFENEETHEACFDMPTDRLVHLVDNPAEEG